MIWQEICYYIISALLNKTIVLPITHDKCCTDYHPSWTRPEKKSLAVKITPFTFLLYSSSRIGSRWGRKSPISDFYFPITPAIPRLPPPNIVHLKLPQLLRQMLSQVKSIFTHFHPLTEEKKLPSILAPTSTSRKWSHPSLQASVALRLLSLQVFNNVGGFKSFKISPSF